MEIMGRWGIGRGDIGEGLGVGREFVKGPECGRGTYAGFGMRGNMWGAPGGGMRESGQI